MYFYTALDWTCQDWTRADPSPFSLCSWKENGEHKHWNFCFLTGLLKAFYILHWNKNEAFWKVARESREKATHAGDGRGEINGLRGSGPERVAVAPRELDPSLDQASAQELTLGKEGWLWWEATQGKGENQPPGPSSAHLEEGRREQLIPTSTVVPPARDGHLNQCILVRPHSSGWPALHSATKKRNVTLKCIYRRKFLLLS